MKFIIFTEFGELLDLALHLKEVEGHEVYMHIPNHDYKRIGDGIIEKVDEWWECIGKGYVWVFDGCSYGGLQDWLRNKEELVFGGSEQGDKLENDRQLGQKLFKAAGFHQVQSKNFKDIESAMDFVRKNPDKRWILKQNGSAPKSINHKAHFHDNSDLIFHLEEMKKKWNESAFGKFDCDLMEIVEGLEVAASVFFNGENYIRNKEGKVVGYLNFEEKKEGDGGTGETVGEMGTTFVGVTEDNPLFKDIIMRPKILEALRAAKFRGVFDINCIKTNDGIVALEPTCRPGIPATSYEFLVGLDNCGKMLEGIAAGLDRTIEIKQNIGMVMVVVAKPFPSEADMDDEATSIGEKLWILNGKDHAHRYAPLDDFTNDQKKRIHLENFEKDEDGNYRVATKNGYLYTVTGFGDSISEVREELINYIKQNTYISGMKYRTDIGVRVEDAEGNSKEALMKKRHEKEIEALNKKHDEELAKIKGSIRELLYNEN